MITLLIWIFAITGAICWLIFFLMLIYIWMDL